jgi:transposase
VARNRTAAAQFGIRPLFSTLLYRKRDLIERFFSKLKHFRRIATRHDKLAENFLAVVQLASVRLWLRVYEFTALVRAASDIE